MWNFLVRLGRAAYHRPSMQPNLNALGILSGDPRVRVEVRGERSESPTVVATLTDRQMLTTRAVSLVLCTPDDRPQMQGQVDSLGEWKLPLDARTANSHYRGWKVKVYEPVSKA